MNEVYGRVNIWSGRTSNLCSSQPGVLDDLKPEERKLGIEAGFAWSDAFEGTGHGNEYVVRPLVAFYADHGFSRGMEAAFERAQQYGRPYEIRYLYKEQDV